MIIKPTRKRVGFLFYIKCKYYIMSYTHDLILLW
nr:MAG TPA: hypothetical protein [Caudoviricetes sp.]